ncbi:hypothetical protein HD554DRAFT_2171918 [Boletus coccyginus]|nr:hypothetical protein HD554DRAFT_2171918 [Boletus coccyginus]
MLLEQETHKVQLRIGEKEMEDKAQACTIEKDPMRAVIPAFPITAAKVAMFLHHELMCEMYQWDSKSNTIEGSSLGKSHIAQVINTLEKHQLNHEYKHPPNHEIQVPLYKDSYIRVFESASKHNGPSWVVKSQAIKTVGTMFDSYTEEELRRCFLWIFADFSGAQSIFIGLRDHAMLLFSLTTTFQGENSCILQWSDLFRTVVPLEQTANIKVLAVLADNAKHNQHGHVDEHGVIWHYHVELCPIGAVALLFFAHFHVLHHPPSNFTFDFV